MYIYLLSFKLNIYTKFKWQRQRSPWKPKRLMNRTTFKIYMTIYKIRSKVLSLGRQFNQTQTISL